MSNFWENIKKPFFVQAPMAGVTDISFRHLFSKYGAPDIFFTEFVSADGLNSLGKENLLIDLRFNENQRPIVAQLFSSSSEEIFKAIQLCKKLKFDGIDINMGCPDRSIEKSGSGADLIKNQKRAKEIIQKAKTANIPISIKTRLGYNKIEIDTWIKFLLEQDLEALTIHLRTRKEMSKVPAHWECMKNIVKLRNEISPRTLIIGNGDIESKSEGYKQIKKTGCDGVMIGRGVFGNPWFFSDRKIQPSKEEKVAMAIEHTKAFKEYLGREKNFAFMKKHYKAYINGFSSSKELRKTLMEEADTPEKAIEILDNVL